MLTFVVEDVRFEEPAPTSVLRLVLRFDNDGRVTATWREWVESVGEVMTPQQRRSLVRALADLLIADEDRRTESKS